MRQKQKRFFYGWVVVAVTALTLLVSGGVRAAPGVFLLPLRADMGWSRASISFAVSLGLVLFGLAGPLSGWLMDRFGPRWLMFGGMLLVASSMALSATMTSVWQLNLFWGALSGIGTGVASTVLGAAVANRWFVARRGVVTGIFGAYRWRTDESNDLTPYSHHPYAYGLGDPVLLTDPAGTYAVDEDGCRAGMVWNARLQRCDRPYRSGGGGVVTGMVGGLKLVATRARLSQCVLRPHHQLHRNRKRHLGRVCRLSQ